MGLLGFQKKGNKTKDIQAVGCEQETVTTGKYIDYEESLHAMQLQRSKYVKIDDNLLRFSFERSEN